MRNKDIERLIARIEAVEDKINKIQKQLDDLWEESHPPVMGQRKE
jgi:uncharacterized protein (UPF0335 family)